MKNNPKPYFAKFSISVNNKPKKEIDSIFIDFENRNINCSLERFFAKVSQRVRKKFNQNEVFIDYENHIIYVNELNNIILTDFALENLPN